MRLIGFSTGALTKDDFRAALGIMARKRVHAIELSALRQNELLPLLEELDRLELHRFEYITFHAPSVMDTEFESVAIEALNRVALRQWPIILQPDAMHVPAIGLTSETCFENYGQAQAYFVPDSARSRRTG